MNLDILGTMTLTAQAILLPVILSAFKHHTAQDRAKFLTVFGLWFLAVVTVAALGFFALPGIGTAGVGIAFLIPIVVALFLFRGSKVFKAIADETPMHWFVGLQVGRMAGIEILMLHAAGRIPATFANSAGWGDVAVGLLALPLAFAIRNGTKAGTRGWRIYALLWNILGLVDLVTAVTLGTGSSEGFPLRFVFEAASGNGMGALPFVLIPTFLVPIYFVLHLMVIRRLWRTRRIGKA